MVVGEGGHSDTEIHAALGMAAKWMFRGVAASSVVTAARYWTDNLNAPSLLERREDMSATSKKKASATPSGRPILHPSKPYWLEQLPDDLASMQNIQSSSALPGVCDVVVIGAGMSGVSTAYHLSRDTDHSIVLLDARGICSGATGRNGGFLHAHGLGEWWPLFQKYGFRTATELCWFERQGRAAIKETAQAHGLDCDIDEDVKLCMLFTDRCGLEQTLGAFYHVRFFLRLFGIKVLNSSEDCAQSLNVDESKKVVSAIVIEKGCDTFWPAKFVLSMARKCLQAGVQIYAHTMVLEVKETGDGKNPIVVHTSRGNILTHKVVFATNAWTSALVKSLSGSIQPVLNTVVSTVPNVGPLLRERTRRTGQDLHPGYHYWHQRKDGRVILGGFRHLLPDRGVGVSEDGIPSQLAVDAALQFLPSLGFQIKSKPKTFEHRWTGIIGWSMDGLPFVGQLPGFENGYICAGFSGHGMTQSWLSGKATANIVQGRAPGSPFVTAFLPTTERVANTSRLGGDWFSYEQNKAEKKPAQGS
jgi:glycine/D-amino acid oxidase-like deaminating enzyme